MPQRSSVGQVRPSIDMVRFTKDIDADEATAMSAELWKGRKVLLFPPGERRTMLQHLPPSLHGLMWTTASHTTVMKRLENAGIGPEQLVGYAE